LIDHPRAAKGERRKEGQRQAKLSAFLHFALTSLAQKSHTYMHFAHTQKNPSALRSWNATVSVPRRAAEPLRFPRFRQARELHPAPGTRIAPSEDQRKNSEEETLFLSQESKGWR